MWIKRSLSKMSFIRDRNLPLILRPRRWGKSLNLSMLRYFLEAPLKRGPEFSREVDLQKMAEKKAFFQDKKILQEHPEMEEHLGKYTLISLSLAGFEANSKESLKQSMNQAKKVIFSLCRFSGRFTRPFKISFFSFSPLSQNL